ncbi:MAG: hypothetical protein H7Y27_07655 [Gemmatimonadaceae bacterium]|nr:hypothetical protein [Chitinophagaceae bacterium]
MNTAEQPVYNIYVEKESNYVIMEWDGYATSEQFREGTEYMLNLLIENKAHYVIGDIKDMILIGATDQEWMNNSFLPRAVRFGFKACALIRPESYFNKVAVETIVYKTDSEKLQINFFENMDDAKAWIASLQNDKS